MKLLSTFKINSKLQKELKSNSLKRINLL